MNGRPAGKPKQLAGSVLEEEKASQDAQHREHRRARAAAEPTIGIQARETTSLMFSPFGLRTDFGLATPLAREP